MLDFLAAFFAGTATLITPCILPMVPVYLGMLIGGGLASEAAGRQRARLVWMTAFFAAGFGLVFVGLGIAAGSLGATLAAHRDAMSLAGAGLVAVFGLLMLGWLRLPGSERDLRFGAPRVIRHPAGGLLFGVVFGLGWTPCAGPLLASILSLAALDGDRLRAASLLLSYSAGLAAPLLLIAAFADRAVPWIRKLSPQLQRLQKFSGVALLLVALSLGYGPAQTLWTQVSHKDQVHTDDGQVLASLTGKAQPSARLVELVEEGCPVCARMQARIDRLQADCEQHAVEVLRVDLSRDANRHLRASLQVRAVPTLLLIDERGQVRHRLVGERSLSEIRGLAAGLQNRQCAGVDPIDPDSLSEGSACGSGAEASSLSCS